MSSNSVNEWKPLKLHGSVFPNGKVIEFRLDKQRRRFPFDSELSERDARINAEKAQYEMSLSHPKQNKYRIVSSGVVEITVPGFVRTILLDESDLPKLHDKIVHFYESSGEKSQILYAFVHGEKSSRDKIVKILFDTEDVIFQNENVLDFRGSNVKIRDELAEKKRKRQDTGIVEDEQMEKASNGVRRSLNLLDKRKRVDVCPRDDVQCGENNATNTSSTMTKTADVATAAAMAAMMKTVAERTVLSQVSSFSAQNFEEESDYDECNCEENDTETEQNDRIWERFRLLTSSVSNLDDVCRIELMFSPYCLPSGPCIPARMMTRIFQTIKDDDDLIARYALALSNVLIQNYVRFPIPQFSDSELFKDCDALANAIHQDQKAFLGDVDQIAAIAALVSLDTTDQRCQSIVRLNAAMSGRTFCNHFCAVAMLQVSFPTQPSIENLWQDDARRFSLCTTILKKRSASNLQNSNLLSAFGLYTFMATNFPPGTAASVYAVIADILKENRNVDVVENLSLLDPCSGFGGRFVGFWFSPQFSKYVGIDPNPRVQGCYRNMLSWLQSHGSAYRRDIDKTFVQFFRACAEEESWKRALFNDENSENAFDAIFTSPPYFDTEIYARDATQSCVRYKTYEQWKNGFLFTMLRNTMSCLKSDGVVVLNVKNGARCPTFVRDVLDFMTSANYRLVKIARVYVPARPNKKRVGSSVSSCEPTLFFCKNKV